MCLLNYVALSLDPTVRSSKDLDNRKVRFEVLNKSTRELASTLDDGPHGEGGGVLCLTLKRRWCCTMDEWRTQPPCPRD